MTGEVECTGEITGSVETGEVTESVETGEIGTGEITESVETGLIELTVSEIKAALFDSIRYGRLPTNSPAKTRSPLFCLTKPS